MKILQVIHGFPPQFRGGTELYLRGLCRELRHLGQDLQVFAGTTHSADAARVEHYDFDGMQVAQLVLSGSYLEHWTRSYSPEAARLFADELRRVRPDVVHVHHWFRLSRNLLETCYRLGIPAVCTLHDLYATCPSFFRVVKGSFTEAPLDDDVWVESLPRLPWMSDAEVRDELDRFAEDFANEMALAHRVIVPSAAHGALVSKLIAIPPERLVVLPHGTITPPPPPAPPRGKRPADAPIRLGYWGHLFRMKGPHLVLEALRRLPDPRRFELHVWGQVVEPGYRRVLDAAGEGLEIRWHGAFTPEDIEKVELDLAVLPSSCSESFSFVLDEAFRLGLPAIVSDRGALAERIGEAGAVFRPESSEDLARVLGEVAADPARLARWRKAVPELHSMADHAREMLELYAEVARRRDMSRLAPDLGLPARRTEALARRVRDRESAMFAYLGRIKREEGRGDHYEKVVEEMIAKEHALGARANEAEAELATARRVAAERARLVEALGREIADLRAALVGEGEPRRREPEAPEVSEHVPGLGSVAAILREDQLALERHARRDPAVAVARRDAMLRFLADELLSLRGAVAAVARGESELDLPAPELPEDGLDLPRLGDAAAISADDTAAIATLLDLERGRAERERRRLDLLGRELAAFGRALDLAAAPPESLEGLPDSVLDREETRETPGFELLAPHLEGGPERLRAFRERLVELHARRQAEGAARAGIERESLELRGREAAREERVAELAAERDRALAALGAQIEDLRRALNLIHQEGAEWTPTPADADEPAVDVPGLGDLEAVRRVNAGLVDEHRAALRARGARDLEMESRLAEFEARIAEFEARIAELEARIAEREASIGESEARIAGLEARVAEREATLSEREATLAERDHRLEDLEGQIVDLERRTAEKRRLIEEIQRDAKALERDSTELRIVAAELEKERGHRDDLIVALGEEIELLRRALVQVNSPREEFPISVPGPCPSKLHVAGHGDIETIRRVDREMVREYLAALGRLRKRWW
ncbi:MAG: glycosyltransferase [Planctomycetota bacterium]